MKYFIAKKVISTLQSIPWKNLKTNFSKDDCNFSTKFVNFENESKLHIIIVLQQ